MGTATNAVLAYGFDLGEEDPGLSERLAKKIGVEAYLHCSYAQEMYALVVSESLVCAARGYPEKVKTLTVKPEWEAKLRDACTRLAIPWREPSWIVFSFWETGD